MVAGEALRGIYVDVESEGQAVEAGDKGWRQRTELVLEVGPADPPIVTRPVTSWEHPYDFPKAGDRLLLRPVGIDNRGALSVELTRESSGQRWETVFSSEEMDPLFGPEGTLAYTEEEWARVPKVSLYLAPSSAEVDATRTKAESL